MTDSKSETTMYELVAYPIKGVSEARAAEIVKKSRFPTTFENNYQLARDTARDISDLPGIRRVDIFTIKTIVKRNLGGAYSMGVYMKDRADPNADFHHKTFRGDPPETRRVRKERRSAKHKKATGR